MRPLFQAITTSVGPVRLIAVNVFNDSGAHADQIIKPMYEELSALDAVLDLMSAHRYETVDIETDDELLFKTFLSVPGVNVSYVESETLEPLYRHVSPGSPVYPLIAEIYAVEEVKPIQDEPEV
ncbi:hypothetical protein [Paenibacillus sp. J22TS3]|uniref:hypothetical protein n=1 Tax=Paenibacillus sp. J22TS3 TaxID=2807192 RepID=UPI001B21F3A1|nr:hypothetical protein [Paenibacillus sp. J22TS3]GIP21060.1 hypothetical protein J22TS3_13350 [Paenibacillus sp. J22TS3]